MKKYSKSDQDPHQSDQDKTEIEKILSKKSPHFTVGTYVIKDNMRGLIESVSTDEKTLRIWWEDDTVSYIPNPRL